jgi:hypothetical protein
MLRYELCGEGGFIFNRRIKVMQKVNKFLKDALQAIMLVWMLTMTVITIDQAASSAFGWKSIFRVRITRV